MGLLTTAKQPDSHERGIFADKRFNTYNVLGSLSLWDHVLSLHGEHRPLSLNHVSVETGTPQLDSFIY